MFIVFEGVDGAGKTTQLEKLVQWLEQHQYQVVTCKDPGSTALGEQIRSLLLGDYQTPIAMLTEMMLFSAARTQLVQEIVKPALVADQVVVLDRYVLSTVVYQGHAGALSTDQIRIVNDIATEGLSPDLTFVLDLPVDVSMQRLGTSLDRMESRGYDYFQLVRDGFNQEADRDNSSIKRINANRPVDTIQNEIREVTVAKLHAFSQKTSED